MNKTKQAKLEKIGSKIKYLVVEMAHKSKSAHIGSSLSISDILTVLYFDTMNIDPKKPEKPTRDRFILSKGHGAAALYAALALRGFFPVKELSKYRVNDGRFHGHPSKEASPGIEVSTGSLGHGLSIGTGMALSLRQSARGAKIFILLGDGECQEGSVWEAAMFAHTHGLNNLVAIIDANGFQGFGKTKDIQKQGLAPMWRGFGWNVLTCDGHNISALSEALEKAKKALTPTVIIANTISGKSIPHIENTLKAHYHVLKQEEYDEIMKQYEK